MSTTEIHKATNETNVNRTDALNILGVKKNNKEVKRHNRPVSNQDEVVPVRSFSLKPSNTTEQKHNAANRKQ